MSLILDLLSSGMTVEHVLEQRTQVSREDMLACVAYGAKLAVKGSWRFRSSVPLEVRSKRSAQANSTPWETGS